MNLGSESWIGNKLFLIILRGVVCSALVEVDDSRCTDLERVVVKGLDVVALLHEFEKFMQQPRLLVTLQIPLRECRVEELESLLLQVGTVGLEAAT